MRQKQGTRVYQRPHAEMSIFDGREHVEFSGDIEDVLTSVALKFGIDLKFGVPEQRRK